MNDSVDPINLVDPVDFKDAILEPPMPSQADVADGGGAVEAVAQAHGAEAMEVIDPIAHIQSLNDQVEGIVDTLQGVTQRAIAAIGDPTLFSVEEILELEQEMDAFSDFFCRKINIFSRFAQVGGRVRTVQEFWQGAQCLGGKCGLGEPFYVEVNNLHDLKPKFREVARRVLEDAVSEKSGKIYRLDHYDQKGKRGDRLADCRVKRFFENPGRTDGLFKLDGTRHERDDSLRGIVTLGELFEEHFPELYDHFMKEDSNI
jgi:hypothetical protein